MVEKKKVSTWSMSQKDRNRLVHALNGNTIRNDSKIKSRKGIKDFATSSFKVVDHSIITKALEKLCHPRDVHWFPKQHCDRFDGVATGMAQFIVSYWRAKKLVSFSGKGAALAKRWVLNELSNTSEYGGTCINTGASCQMETDGENVIGVVQSNCSKEEYVVPDANDIEMIESKNRGIVKAPRVSPLKVGPGQNTVVKPENWTRTNFTTSRTLDLEVERTVMVPKLSKHLKVKASNETRKNTDEKFENFRKSGVCFRWRSGKCKRGNVCRFRHSEDRPQNLSNGEISELLKGEEKKNGIVGIGDGKPVPVEQRSVTEACRELLKVVRRNPNAKAFLKPVDFKGLGYPSYPQIIKTPMDLQSVGNKLDQGLYLNSLEFYNNVKLIWSNSMTFNQDRSEYFVAAEKMGNLWEREFSKKFRRQGREKPFFNEEMLHHHDPKSAHLAPPNLASPRFCKGNSQKSGTASWSNVVKFLEAQNGTEAGEYDKENNKYCEAIKFDSKQTMYKQKRKRGQTPKSSPKITKDNNSKRARLGSTLNLIKRTDGTVSLESFLALEIGELRSLGEELELNIPSKLKKKELRQKISEGLKIQSGKSAGKVINHLETPKMKVQRHFWTPPKVFEISSPLSPIRIENKNPEKGVRIMRMSELDKDFGDNSRSNIKMDIPSPKEANSCKTNIAPDHQLSTSKVVNSGKTKLPVNLKHGKVKGSPNNSSHTDQLLDLVQNLKEEIKSLKVGLKKSEDLRKGMGLRMAQMQDKENLDSLTNVMALGATRSINDRKGQQMGLLWNLSSEGETLGMLDDHMGKLEHSCRCSNEHPIAILSSI